MGILRVLLAGRKLVIRWYRGGGERTGMVLVVDVVRYTREV